MKCVLLLLASVAVWSVAEGSSDSNPRGTSPLLQQLARFEVIDIKPAEPARVVPMSVADIQHFGVGSNEEKRRFPHQMAVSFQAYGHDFHLDLVKNHQLIPPHYVEYSMTEHGSKLHRNRQDVLHCFYHGKLVGDDQDLTVTASTCHGLRANIRAHGELFIVEPAEPHLQADTWDRDVHVQKLSLHGSQHLVYRHRDVQNHPPFVCGVGAHKHELSEPPSTLHHHQEHEHEHSDDAQPSAPSGSAHSNLKQAQTPKTRGRAKLQAIERRVDVTAVNDLERFNQRGVTTQDHTLSIFNEVAAMYLRNTGADEVVATKVNLGAQFTFISSMPAAIDTSAGSALRVSGEVDSNALLTAVGTYMDNTAGCDNDVCEFHYNGPTAAGRDQVSWLIGVDFTYCGDLPCNTGVVGLAGVRAICEDNSGSKPTSVNQMVGHTDAFDAATVAHELGHNLGWCHDPTADRGLCNSYGDINSKVANAATVCNGKIMSAFSSLVSPASDFSLCTNEDAKSYTVGQTGTCLSAAIAPPKVTYGNVSICGNGFIEPGEDCDCALDGDCSGAASPFTDRCCNGTSCTFLQPNYVCSETLSCCDGCLAVRAAGFACRPEGQGVAAKECDVAEVCDGVSPVCPLDLFDPGDDGDGQNCPVDLATQVVRWIQDNWETLAVIGVGLVILILAYKGACKCYACCCGDGEQMSAKRVVRRVRSSAQLRGVKRGGGGAEKPQFVGGIRLPTGWVARYTRDGIPVYVNTRTGERYDFRAGPPKRGDQRARPQFAHNRF